ncbi:DVU_1555 family C-GCAxxG-C-C protein [Maridesulfovibrio sp.]|uniref:DVU_1555 family C-GCAxxG-C-C protein n=1 Tax=Maridesulfovibrio sp. TaxID=2795000 RepID=UPI0029C9D229|nr:DV_1555 family C-GCAxxG-C-C protein [Maridesulfovibrio sp.]
MTETDLRIMQLNGAGYCCAQIIIILCLDNLQQENPALVRAAQGLCMGMGDCAGTCGILSGGLCALGLYAGKGTDTESAADNYPLLVEDFREWFKERTVSEFGGISCSDILDDECGSPRADRCGVLLVEAYTQLLNILMENGFDPAEGRDGADGY